MAKIVRRQIHEARLEEGWHKAKVHEVSMDYGVVTPFGVKDQATLTFLAGPEEVELAQKMTLSLAPKSRLFQTIEQITGKAPGREYDLEELEGMLCEIFIDHKEMESGDTWERIREVRASKGKKAPQKQAPVKQAADLSLDFDDEAAGF